MTENEPYAAVKTAVRSNYNGQRDAVVAADADALGAALQDVQEALGHADPRTTRRYDRSPHNLDRSPTTYSPPASSRTLAPIDRSPPLKASAPFRSPRTSERFEHGRLTDVLVPLVERGTRSLQMRVRTACPAAHT
jgi:hypothetical protein